jgi:hypothetical protein
LQLVRFRKASVSRSSASLRVPDGSDHLISIPSAMSLLQNSIVHRFLVMAVRS